jgi:enoyl-CoA hydratase/carnithine racemase
MKSAIRAPTTHCMSTPPPTFETLRLSLDGVVATLTLKRPEHLNAAPPPMFDEPRAALQRYSNCPPWALARC